MPRDPSGIMTFPAGTRGVPNTVIESAKYNAMLDDAEGVLSETINIDGTVPFVANQSMGGNRITSLGDGTANGNAATVGQVQSGIVSQATVVGGTVDAIALTFSPVFTAYTTGMRVRFISAGPNTTNATVTIDSMAVKGIRKFDDQLTVAGDLGPVGHVHEMVYTGTRFMLLNPYSTIQSGTDNVFTSTLATAAIGPILDLHRNSASPAASDAMGSLDFSGKSSTAVTRTYARIAAQIIDPTNASEDGEIVFRTITAGTLTNALKIGQGIYTPSVTDKGTDTINAVTHYVNNVLMYSEVIKSATETVNNSATLQADDELLFTMAASTRYRFEFEIFYSSTAAADFKFELDSTGATDPTTIVTAYSWMAPGAAGSYTSGVISTINTSISPVSGTTGDGHILIRGYVLNGADAGDLRLRWAQDTSTVVNTSIYRGSNLRYRIV